MNTEKFDNAINEYLEKYLFEADATMSPIDSIVATAIGPTLLKNPVLNKQATDLAANLAKQNRKPEDIKKAITALVMGAASKTASSIKPPTAPSATSSVPTI